MSIRIVGLSAFYHNSAAAIIEDGRVVAAAEEERFSRIKHDAAFPANALRYCLDQAGCRGSDIDFVVYYDKPFLKFERLLHTYLATAPRGFTSFRTAIPTWLREKLFQKTGIGTALDAIDPGLGGTTRLLFSEHHLSHAASAFYPSPFEEAAILTMDGVGEWTTTSQGLGKGASIEILREIRFPHSLGLLYSAFTTYCGFRVNSGEYKLMGLAPYGTPRYRDLILDNLLDLKADGSFWLDQSYFDYCTGLTMTSPRFHALFGRSPREPESALESFHADMAASVQAVVELSVLRMTRAMARETGCPNLCMAGGVALNCVANGKILRDGAFREIWIQPAAGDSGGALGAALAAYHLHLSQPRRVPDAPDGMNGALLGPAFDQQDIEARLRACGAHFTRLDETDLIEACADALERGEALGWFQGRMEFGPRALGARSILADPRSATMQARLNLKIKKRESFRPFAPAILQQDAVDWFNLDRASPFMLFVAELAASHRDDAAVAPSSGQQIALRPLACALPATTHVDASARVQTVNARTNDRFHRLLRAFKARTDCPALVNTSFNERGEPIVCQPEEAFACFMATDLDVLAIGNCLLKKSEQSARDGALGERVFAPD
jgi:carbamoyltransferase